MNIEIILAASSPARTLVITVGLLTVALAAAPAPATAGCLDWQQNVFDSSSSCLALPSIDRYFDLRSIRWQSGSYLLVNTGNDVAILDVGPAPLDPSPVADSDFQVPHYGDSDYDLLSMSVCDDCRFGVTFYKLGVMVFDLGTAAVPGFAGSTFLAASSTHPGGLVFPYAGAEYLLVSSDAGSCGTSPTLYQIDAGDPDPELMAIGCPAIIDDQSRIVGGTSIVRGANTTLWVGDNYAALHVVRVYDDNGAVGLQPIDQPFDLRADTGGGSGLAVDQAARIAVTASTPNGVRLWNISDAEHPQPLWSAPDLAVNRAALAWPLLWVGKRGTVSESHTFDLSDPGHGVEIAAAVWDPVQPWNSVSCASDHGAVFAPDGGALYLGRYSVAQVFDPSQCDGLAGGLILLDGFESGTLAAWSSSFP